MATIGIDLGGTKILAAVIHHGEAHHVSKVATPTTGADDVVAAIAQLIDHLSKEHDVDVHQVGVGAPGPIDPADGVVLHGPNLPGFAEPVPLAEMLAEALGSQVEVRVGNDVNVAALGEWRHGAGKGHDDLLALWWGTGIGGGLILDGALRDGPNGTAGEIGHITYRADGRRCGCGRVGHVEAYAGRAAMEAEARRRHDGGETTKLVEMAGADRMRSKIFSKALAADDYVAIDLLATAVDAIGVGIASAVTLVDVDLVIIGGGLGSRLGQRWADRIGAVVTAKVFANPDVRVVSSALGDNAGVIGAAELFAD